MFVYLSLAIAVLLIIIDQAIKFWAASSLKLIPTIPLIQDVLHLTYRENKGAAFSILEGKTFFLIIITAAMLLVMLYILLKKVMTHPVIVSAFSLIIAGGIGNLIDRIFRPGGIVVDYIDFRLINFPVFNFADICVVIGTALFIIYLIFLEPKEEKKKKQTKEDPSQNGGADENE